MTYNLSTNMIRAEDCVPALHRSSNGSITELARRFGAQSLQQHRSRQQCAVIPSPINEDFAHHPSQPFTKSSSLFQTLNPFSAHARHPPSPTLERSEPVSPMEVPCQPAILSAPVSVPSSHSPSSASGDTTRTDASSPPPSVFSQGSHMPSAYSSPTITRPGSSASAESMSYSGVTDTNIRRQRQRVLRRQTSSSHLAEVRALINRMVDQGEMCEVNASSRAPSPAPDRISEETVGEDGGFGADTMDLDDDFVSQSASRSGSEASALFNLKYRRSSDWTSDRGSVSSMVKEPRIQKRTRASSGKGRRR